MGCGSLFLPVWLTEGGGGGVTGVLVPWKGKHRKVKKCLVIQTDNAGKGKDLNDRHDTMKKG